MTNPSAFTLVNPQNGNLAFKIFSFDDNSHFDHLQRHNYYCILLITEGSGELKADFSTYDFSPAVMMCFSPYQPFMIQTKDTLRGIALFFHPDFFCIHKHQKEVACNGILFNNIYNPPFIHLEAQDIAVLSSYIEQMKVEIQQIELAQYELLVSLLKIFLIHSSRIKAHQMQELPTNWTDSKEPFILQHLKEYIESHFKSKHAPSDYAALLNITPKALAKISKSHFNKTITDLIAERIIIEAKRELYLTSKSVKEIAYELGYEDEHYFSRFFKNNAEISPQLYRETVGFARAEV